MPPQINLNELYSMQRRKTITCHVCFDKILEICHRRIRTVASHGGLNTFFEIPGMLVGYPLYNIFESCDYVVKALRKNGLFVQILQPPHVGVLYISWDPKELAEASREASRSRSARPHERPALAQHAHGHGSQEPRRLRLGP